MMIKMIKKLIKIKTKIKLNTKITLNSVELSAAFQAPHVSLQMYSVGQKMRKPYDCRLSNLRHNITTYQ